jgi:D-3-phosphoglycerate dehydrogenase / 2-oxoglutarate reductase
MKVLISEPENYSQDAINIYKEIGPTYKLDSGDDLNAALLSDVEILVIRLRYFIGSEVMDSAPKLKFIVSPTTGLNHIDLSNASMRGIKVLSLKGEVNFLKCIPATAEHTLALMLSLVRRLPSAVVSVNQGFWERDNFIGKELKGKSLGILGFGRIGTQVANYARAFGMKVYAYDLKKDIHSDFVTFLSDPNQLVALVDIVSVHIDLNDQTYNFINKDLLSYFKVGSYLINTSRGEIIDEKSLLKALESNRIAGAALDVLSDENNSQKSRSTHRLLEWARKNTNRLIVTPHIGGATSESMSHTEKFMAKKVLNHIDKYLA